MTRPFIPDPTSHIIAARAMYWTATRSFLLLACFSLAPVLALYTKKDAVVQLNEYNFKKEVLRTEHAVMVEFFAPWCGHCKALAPEYKKAAAALAGIVKIAAIDCDQEQGLCARYDIKGFPTIKLFPGASSFPDKEGKFANYKVPVDYNGARDAKGIKSFAISKVPNYVTPVGEKAVGKTVTIDDFLADERPKALNFTNTASNSALFKALSVDFHHNLIFGEVKKSQKEIVSRYNITKFPTLLMLPKENDAPVIYNGPLKHAKVYKFFKQYASPAPPPAEPKPKSKTSKSKTEAKKSAQPFDASIAQIKSQAQLEKQCLEATGICVLTFSVLEPEYPESVEAHNSTLTLLSKIKTRHHSQSSPSPFRFFWINALEETRLPTDFRLSDDRPALMAVNAPRKLYRPFTGAFDEAGLIQWFKDTAVGKGRNFNFDFKPTMSSSSATEKVDDVAATTETKEETEDDKKTSRDEL